jgi:tetratricopeptide (TPR) repeat protein
MDDLYADFSALTPELRAARAKLLAHASRFAPPGFDLETFCDDLAGHLEAPPDKKLLLFSDLVIRNVPTALLLEVREELDESIERWNDVLGPATAAAVRRKVARHGADPLDLDALAALPREDPDEDAAVLLYTFARTAGRDMLLPAEQRRLLRAAAAAGPVHPDVQAALGKFLTILANDELEDRLELLDQAEQWFNRVLAQAPEDPEHLGDFAHVLVERALTLGGQASVPLLRQASAHYAAALRCAGAQGTLDNVVNSALLGQATANWHLTEFLTDPEESKRLLEESMEQLQQLIDRTALEADLCSFLGSMAFDLGRLPGSEQSRRQAFEIACSRFEDAVAADPADARATCQWARALLGLAGLTPVPARQPLVERAAALFAEAIRLLPAAVWPCECAAAAWLELASASTDAERRAAAERAQAAARRALELEPEECGYNLACALSLLDRAEEAAQVLIAVLEHQPEMVAQALNDPDLAPLFEACPDLPAGLERAELERQAS